uniref:Ribonuclease 3 n=1 Tax=Cyanothece sp. (strain PCC 7425 / ATCC 29141) TaxID=395961 RepID=B8HSY4_CYAP4
MNVKDPRRQKQLEKLIDRLGLVNPPPIRWDLLDLALTHPTFSPQANYEQLEFFGDAVARLTVAQFLRQTYPDRSVGEWTAIRSVLVSDRTLATIGDSYGLERFLLMGSSAAADASGQTSRLADAMEALLAALYLSTSDFRLIHPWLDRHWQPLAEAILNDPAHQNYKAALQTWTQATSRTLPEYRVQEIQQASPEERFQAEVWVQGVLLGQGTGRSIKAAEKAAAQVAYLSLPPLPQR